MARHFMKLLFQIVEAKKKDDNFEVGKYFDQIASIFHVLIFFNGRNWLEIPHFGQQNTFFQ